MSNSWKLTVEKDGAIVREEAGNMELLPELFRKNGAATVGLTYGNSLDFGKEKVSAFVTLTCDQDEQSIDMAGQLAFKKAMQLTEMGWDLIIRRAEAEGEKVPR